MSPLSGAYLATRYRAIARLSKTLKPSSSIWHSNLVTGGGGDARYKRQRQRHTYQNWDLSEWLLVEILSSLVLSTQEVDGYELVRDTDLF